jgi:hypothetical protein
MLLTTICADDRQEWQQQNSKEDPLSCWTSISYFFGHEADFHEGHGSVEALVEHDKAYVCELAVS